VRLLLSATLSLLVLAGCGASASTDSAETQGLFDRHAGVEIARFPSEAAFRRFVEQTQERFRTEAQNSLGTDVFAEESSDLSTMPPPPQEEPPPAPVLADTGSTGSFDVEHPANPAITNNQTIGVDEGGIVKQIGRFLVVLQDGRLFSADLGAGEGAPLRLADRIDVYRSREKAADWYDEMLVHGDRILVTAYNYREGASEITVLRIDPEGRLSREGRFLLGSNDYYSTANYSTRLVGDSLVFYAPVAVTSFDGDRPFQFPRLRRARGDGEADAGEALIGPTDIYAPLGDIQWPVIHTLSICPLRGSDLDCRTTAFVGASSREIYVSPTDAFLWIGAPDGLPWAIEYANERRRACPQDVLDALPGEESGLVYRVPLDGSAVGAVALGGFPVDQFALDSRDGRFRALVQRPGDECPGRTSVQPLALLDLPLAAFGTNVRHLAASAYRPLPPIDGDQLENRFLGDWLIYGGRSGRSDDPTARDGRTGPSSVFAVPLGHAGEPLRLRLPHNTLRIERAGNDAVVTGYGGRDGLSLSYLSLGEAPRLAATATLAGRFESEGRSHAFNAAMRPDGTGLIGLPTTRRVFRAGRGWSDSESSDLSYVRIAADRSLAHAGELSPGRRRAASGYRCLVSCVDWYGNSRPIFTGGRIFALMGTDLVEGRLVDGRIAEAGRVDLTGQPQR
jgi:hypothetical protein